MLQCYHENNYPNSAVDFHRAYGVESLATHVQESTTSTSFYEAMLEINFLAGSNYLLPGMKGSSKSNIPSSKHGGPITGHCPINDNTIPYYNAFDNMGLCFVISVEQ